MKKCICQVCSCGRHRCPHTLGQQNRVINKSKINSCNVTEYKGKFNEISPKRGPFRRPRDQIKREGETSSETTNATSYISHDVQVPKPREQEKFVPNPHKFDTVSENHEHYKRLKGVPARMPPYLKTTTMRKPSARIDYVSTKQDDFRAWASSSRPDAITREKPYRPPSKPFQETSTHRQDFTRFNQAPNPSARQPDKLNFGNNPVHFQTTNRTFHKPLKMVPVQVLERPPDARSPSDARGPPKSAFTSTSVFKSDFVDHKAIKSAHMFKPASLLFKTSDSMDCQTTQGDSFKAWPIETRQPKAVEIYKRPEGLIESKPTSSDYSNHGELAVAAKSARPRTKLRRGREFPFNPTTSYSLEFKTYNSLLRRRENPPRQSAKDGNDIFPKPDENGAATATTEFLDKYTRHQAVPARMCKGGSSLFKTGAHFSDTSMYKEQFRGERIECPSEGLLRGDKLGVFSFDHVSEEGHKIYEVSPRGADNIRREVTVA